jgi:TRAP-type mannitol/chloroaromatic compound transport system substrate-binding protein
MKLTSIFTAAALAFGLVASAAAQTTMKSSISIAQNSHQGIGIDVFAKEVEKRTQGRIKIQNFYSGSLGGERESIEAVQLGTQELTFTSTGLTLCPKHVFLTFHSCSATKRMHARSWTGLLAKRCWPNLKPRVSKRWLGVKMAYAT